MAVAIRAWNGTRWVVPWYNVGTTDVPVWSGFTGVNAFIPHMDDTFGGNGDKEWFEVESATTPEGDGYIYSERAGLNRLQDVVQPPPARQNIGKNARIQVVARVELLAGTTSISSLDGCYLRFEVWDAFVNPPSLPELPNPNPPSFGNVVYEYQTEPFPATIDTGWVTYEPSDFYVVRNGVPEFHRVILDGMTEDITTRVSLSRWTAIDTATGTIMGYVPPRDLEIIPRFWDGTAWVPQTMD